MTTASDAAEDRAIDAALDGAGDGGRYDALVGELQYLGLAGEPELPGDLRDRILAAAPRPSAVAQPVRKSEPAAATGLRSWAGWIAACVALVAWAAGGTDAPQPDDAASLRADLLARPGVTRAAWRPGPTGEAAGGEVVWHAGLQRGVMRFDSLPANDPREAQYQLWVFDAERDERYPVDGGVFDVGEGEWLVVFRPAVPVSEATLFAVTLERPGGVVVSDRSRLPLLARVGG